MNYWMLDLLRCNFENKRMNVVSAEVRKKKFIGCFSITVCSNWCGLKQIPVRDGGPGPEDCAEC